jgi:sulfur-oxidizing protein SoxZ
MSLPTRIVMPTTARKGQVIEVKTIVQHPMETGYRRDHRGAVIPRDIIKRVVVTYAGNEVFAVDATQGIAANPYFAFHFKAVETGDVVFTWIDEHGVETRQTRRIQVS